MKWHEQWACVMSVVLLGGCGGALGGGDDAPQTIASAQASAGTQAVGPQAPAPPPPPTQAPVASMNAAPQPGGVRLPCAYGELGDGHFGFLRCLRAGEIDPAGSTTTTTTTTTAVTTATSATPTTTATAEPASEPSTEPAGKGDGEKPIVSVKKPTVENGSVAKIEKTLKKLNGDIAKCVADGGGLVKKTGTVRVKFLVRTRGKAEGVEVTTSKHVPAGVDECVRNLFKNKNVGAPSADNVSVTVDYALKRDTKSK